jgi:hypothetical protein
MAARFRTPPPARTRRVNPVPRFAAVYVMPRPALRPARLVVLDCPVCELHAGPFPPAEAGQLAGTHDDLMHGGRPTAFVSPDPDSRPTFTVGDPAGGPTLGGAA